MTYPVGFWLHENIHHPRAAEFRSERSFNRNIERIHENMKTLRHPCLSFDQCGVS